MQDDNGLLRDERATDADVIAHLRFMARHERKDGSKRDASWLDAAANRLAAARPPAPDVLREALRPFADCCDQIADTESDEEWAKFRLLVKDYRRARAALAANAPEGAQPAPDVIQWLLAHAEHQPSEESRHAIRVAVRGLLNGLPPEKLWDERGFLIARLRDAANSPEGK